MRAGKRRSKGSRGRRPEIRQGRHAKRFQERLYGAVLRFYPSHFRSRVGPELLAAFRRGLGEAGHRHRFFAREMADLLLNLPTEWWESFVGLPQVQGRCVGPGSSLGHLLLDVRFALRALRRRPGFASTAVAVLGVGIGATTVIFTVFNAVLLRPLPYPDSQRLVTVWQTREAWAESPNPLLRSFAFQYPVPWRTYQDWLAQNSCFEALGVHTDPTTLLLAGGEFPELVEGAETASSLFVTLGVAPALGRVLVPSDDAMGAAPVAVLSHDLWTSSFGSDPAVVGRSVTLEGVAHTIVGVMPQGFYFPSQTTRIWTSVTDQGKSPQNGRVFWAVGRLKPDVSIHQAHAEMEALQLHITERAPEHSGYGVRVVDRREAVVGDAPAMLRLLLAAVVILLFVTCANIANLLLMRASERRHELAVRTALGARQGRLLGQFMTESVVLALLGGALGLGLSLALGRFPPSGVPSHGRDPGGRHGLHSGGPGLPGHRGPHGGPSGAESLPRTLRSAPLRRRKPHHWRTRRTSHAAGNRDGRGRPQLRLAHGSRPPDQESSEDLRHRSGLRRRARGVGCVQVLGCHAGEPGGTSTCSRTVPGAAPVSSGSARGLLLGMGSLPGGPSGGPVHMMGPSGLEEPNVGWNYVGEGFFDVLRVPIISGRAFGPADMVEGANTAIISETLARAYWPGEDPVGKRIGTDSELDRTIVGVAADMRHPGGGGSDQTAEPRALVYLPRNLRPRVMGLVVSVSVRGEPSGLVSAIPDIAREVDPGLLATPHLLRDRVRATLAGPRSRAQLVSLLALLAGFLAAIGVYGVLSFAVAQRTHEVGIRRALGAPTRSVFASVFNDGMLLIGRGIAVGGVVALGVVAVLPDPGEMLYQTHLADPSILLAAALLLCLTGAIATGIPAARAVGMDPGATLRRA